MSFEDKRISWGIFHHGLPQALLLEKLWDHPLHFHPIERFYELCQAPDKPDYKFPHYCFLEPTFRDPEESDQHPPADVMNGELLIAKVYNAIRSSDIWNKCLLVITHDEHGGSAEVCSYRARLTARAPHAISYFNRLGYWNDSIQTNVASATLV